MLRGVRLWRRRQQLCSRRGSRRCRCRQTLAALAAELVVRRIQGLAGWADVLKALAAFAAELHPRRVFVLAASALHLPRATLRQSGSERQGPYRPSKKRDIDAVADTRVRLPRGRRVLARPLKTLAIAWATVKTDRQSRRSPARP